MKDTKYKLLFVGAGGTGTYVLKEFSRYLLDNDLIKSRISGMAVLDGDIVEAKNLKRQAFVEEDIGLNKASVMAEVLNDSFGLKFQSYGTYLTSVEKTGKIMESLGSKYDVEVIISCVDNHGARLMLEEYFSTVPENAVYIDAANEFSDGECVVAVKAGGKILSPCRSHYYPHIKEGDTRNVTEMSCEELNNVAPQHILANMQSALFVLANLVNLLEKGSVTGGFSIFNVFNKFSKEYAYEASEE